jgi:Rha family phage regulatory protein
MMMGEIIRLLEIDGAVFTSSLDVARYYRKRHDNVVRDIEVVRATVSSDLRSRWFREDKYYNSQNHSQPCIDMTRQGFAMVMGRYGGPKFVAYILKFDEMEAKLGVGAKTAATFDLSVKTAELVGFPPKPPQQELFAGHQSTRQPILFKDVPNLDDDCIDYNEIDPTEDVPSRIPDEVRHYIAVDGKRWESRAYRGFNNELSALFVVIRGEHRPDHRRKPSTWVQGPRHQFLLIIDPHVPLAIILQALPVNMPRAGVDMIKHFFEDPWAE